MHGPPPPPAHNPSPALSEPPDGLPSATHVPHALAVLDTQVERLCASPEEQRRQVAGQASDLQGMEAAAAVTAEPAGLQASPLCPQQPTGSGAFMINSCDPASAQQAQAHLLNQTNCNVVGPPTWPAVSASITPSSCLSA